MADDRGFSTGFRLHLEELAACRDCGTVWLWSREHPRCPLCTVGVGE